MTEEQWRACTDPWAMLDYIGGRATNRKMLLFAVASCRHVWHLMTDSRHRAAVEAAERFADGLLSETEFEVSQQPVAALWRERSDASENHSATWDFMTAATRHLDTPGGARYASNYAARGLACLAGPEGSPEHAAAQQAEEATQCDLIRDLFGDPSGPFVFDQDWLSGRGSIAVERAREIYAEGKFESLAFLADALEQAGYHDRAVLEHCRSTGRHIRGCWVVDALLGHESAVRTGLVMDASWQTWSDPTPLLYFLLDKGSARKWRLFAVACCRRIGHLIVDERCRRAVEVAARYADGIAAADEVEMARAAAQQAEDEAHQAEYWAEADANFSITPAYAAACCRLYVARAARSAICRDPRSTDAEPGTYDAEYWRTSNEWAAAAVKDKIQADFGSTLGDTRWDEANRISEAAQDAELKVQCDLLRDLFGEYLGPLGKEGAWLPTGLATKVNNSTEPAEQWCRLPTRRKIEHRQEWLIWNGGAVRKIADAIYQDESFDRLPILADALEEAGCTDTAILDHCRAGGKHFRGCWVVDLVLGKM